MQHKTYALVIAPIFAISVLKLTIALIGALSIPIASIITMFSKRNLKQKAILIIVVLLILFVFLYFLFKLIFGDYIESDPENGFIFQIVKYLQ